MKIGTFHQAMNRGYDGNDIFAGNKNKAQFLEFLEGTAKKQNRVIRSNIGKVCTFARTAPFFSTMISNIYLHEALDKWYAEEIRPTLKGRSMSIIVRFADDAVIGFESKEEAEKVLEALTRRFEEYGLALHSEKTRLIYFGKPRGDARRSDGNRPATFDFLGFTHYWGKSYKGNWVVRRRTAGKKFREKLKKINEWCRKKTEFSEFSARQVNLHLRVKSQELRAKIIRANLCNLWTKDKKQRLIRGNSWANLFISYPTYPQEYLNSLYQYVILQKVNEHEYQTIFRRRIRF